jgi:hypothetical protein
MKQIPLGHGKFAKVDDQDYDYLMQWNWRCSASGYAVRWNGYGTYPMHRQIMNPPDSMVVDHINQDKRDNRRENLRVCTRSQNRHNVPVVKNSSSGYKGVQKHGKRWKASISRKLGDDITIGVYDDPKEAARAYDEKAREIFGEYAWLNFPA